MTCSTNVALLVWYYLTTMVWLPRCVVLWRLIRTLVNDRHHWMRKLGVRVVNDFNTASHSWENTASIEKGACIIEGHSERVLAPIASISRCKLELWRLHMYIVKTYNMWPGTAIIEHRWTSIVRRVIIKYLPSDYRPALNYEMLWNKWHILDLNAVSIRLRRRLKLLLRLLWLLDDIIWAHNVRMIALEYNRHGRGTHWLLMASHCQIGIARTKLLLLILCVWGRFLTGIEVDLGGWWGGLGQELHLALREGGSSNTTDSLRVF